MTWDNMTINAAPAVNPNTSDPTNSSVMLGLFIKSNLSSPSGAVEFQSTGHSAGAGWLCLGWVSFWTDKALNSEIIGHSTQVAFNPPRIKKIPFWVVHETKENFSRRV